MVKKSYGCAVFGIALLAVGGWYGYRMVVEPLARFESDALSLRGRSEADVRALLGDESEKASYRDHRTTPRIHDLVDLYPGIKPIPVEHHVLIYVKFKRCAIFFINSSGRVTDVEYGQME